MSERLGFRRADRKKLKRCAHPFVAQFNNFYTDGKTIECTSCRASVELTRADVMVGLGSHPADSAEVRLRLPERIAR